MTQVFQITLDEVGRILVPASVRERLNLSPGMTLIVEKGEKGGVQLRLQSKPTALVEKEGLLVARVTALSDLTDNTRHERDRRVFDLLQRVGLCKSFWIHRFWWRPWWRRTRRMSRDWHGCSR